MKYHKIINNLIHFCIVYNKKNKKNRLIFNVFTFLLLQKSSSWVPYLSMLCVFAFILSFGLGPGHAKQEPIESLNIFLTSYLTNKLRIECVNK